MKIINACSRLVRRWSSEQSGQTLVEYSLIILMVAIGLIGALQTFAGGVNGMYGVIQTAVDALSGA